MSNPYLPQPARIVDRTDEATGVFTLDLQLSDEDQHRAYHFVPGQFNMLSVHGVGEIPISISSDPAERDSFAHTIRDVGRVSGALARLRPGDEVGLRGPYGRGWPLHQAEDRDVIVVTGGLGCAPTVSVINYVLGRRADYGRLVIMQGVKHANDLIWRQRYAAWDALSDTQVLLAADSAGSAWPWHVGRVTALFDQAQYDTHNCAVFMCGPEPMMIGSARDMVGRGVDPSRIWISMERNMHCAVGHCGHCQFGPYFVCRDGPVFEYSEIAWLLGMRGY